MILAADRLRLFVPATSRFVLALLVTCCVSLPASAIEFERPNIVLIIADDMNWDNCGAYGHASIRTPNINRLAEEGTQFEFPKVRRLSCNN